jgi:pyruvate,water dikinase
MPPLYVHELGTRSIPPTIGSKAEKLRFLIRQGWQVPAGWVCSWEAHLRYRDKDPDIRAVLRTELLQKLAQDRLYAVRSSANVEDGSEHSFAGQFKTVLNVRGIDAVLTAMLSIWASTRESGVRNYLEKSGIETGDLRMAIIIQEMVEPCISGISFSKNPMTGMDEVIVEAVQGSGETLLQEGAMPMRWINKWGSWTAKAEVQDPDLELIEEVVRQTKAIAKQYGRPVDLEWVYDGQALNWVQLREITTLDIPIYSNRISREMFPGIIKPLIWSVNVPLVNGAWVRLLTELIGPHDIEPESLAGLFYHRAYFNMGTFGQILEMLGFPREMLELLMGIEAEGTEKPSFRPTRKTYSLLPRMLVFAVDKLRFASKLDQSLPQMDASLRARNEADVGHLSEGELLDRIDGLFQAAQQTAYNNIVATLLMQIYDRVLAGRLSRIGVDMQRFDLTAGMEELNRFEPNVHLARLKEQYSELDSALQKRIRKCSYQEFCLLTGVEAFQRGVAQFIDQFGHLSDSGNDFSSVPWRDNPDMILRMIIDYEPARIGAGHKIKFDDLELPMLPRLLVGALYKRARRFRWYREATSSLYTFEYGLFRNYFLALGDHLAQRGAIASREDIFHMYCDEVRETVEGDEALSQLQGVIERRKHEIERDRAIEPPSIIYGDRPPPPQAPSGNRLTGIPTSRGSHTGRAKVLLGIEDFDRLEVGDVLVIPYSDVGWTPLFAKAGAVVAESGGILSHSSIVAREYNIPAVVSVLGACRFLDDTIVTVDGYRGEITVHDSLQNELNPN